MADVHARHMAWPTLAEPYDDEFGAVDPMVFEAAGRVWPQAEHYARRVLRDGSAGFPLMMRAVATVSRVRADPGAGVRYLDAYLLTTYRRFVLAEASKESGRKDLLSAHAAHAADWFESTHGFDGVDRRVLIRQLTHRMDPWTRRVFALLLQGYSFDDIGRLHGRSPQGARNRFRDSLRRLRRQIERRGAPDVHAAPAANDPRRTWDIVPCICAPSSPHSCDEVSTSLQGDHTMADMNIADLQKRINEGATKAKFLKAPAATLKEMGVALTPEMEHHVAYLADALQRPGHLVPGVGIAPGDLRSIRITIGVDF